MGTVGYGLLAWLAGGIAPTLSWVLVFAALTLGLRDPRERGLAQLSFVVLTLLGLTIVFDNVANFGTPFSGGHDDSDYFYRILARLQGARVPFEAYLFQYLNLAYAWVVSTLTLRGPAGATLYDVLPLNWAAASLCAVYADRVVTRLAGRSSGWWLILVPLLTNHNFVGNVARFYRDVYVALFVLVVVDCAVRSRFGAAALSTAALALFRMGNALICGLYVVLAYIIEERRVRRVRTIYALSLALALGGYFGGLSEYGNLVYAATSRVESVDRYVRAFEGETYGEIIGRRMLEKARSGQNEARRAAIEGGGLVSAGYKLAYSMFFPITFYGPQASMEFNAIDSTVTYRERGFFIYNVVKWIYVLAWIFVVPNLVIGVYLGLTGRGQLLNVTCLYLMTLVAVSQLSFQVRHTVAFVVLNPLFVTIGYRGARGRLRTAQRALAVATGAIILAYNLYKFT